MWKRALKKFGAMLGDFVEVGYENSVLNPGTSDWTGSNVWPSPVRGVVPRGTFTRPGRRGRSQALKISQLEAARQML